MSSNITHRILIVTDSASDITTEELIARNVTLVPMELICGDDSFKDDKSVSMSALWARMQAGERLITAQPSIGTYLDIFTKAKEDGDHVIYIGIAATLSGSCQTAHAAAEMVNYPSIYIVDSCAASVKQLMSVRYACDLRDEGRLTAAEIAEKLKAFRDRVRLIACIDTLEYLVRGGRLSKTAGTIGTLLDIKPIISLVDDGSVSVLHKVRGLRRSTAALCDLFTDQSYDPAFLPVPIYACDDRNCQNFLGTLAERMPVDAFAPPAEIGATIGAHIGPGGFGVVYVIKEA